MADQIYPADKSVAQPRPLSDSSADPILVTVEEWVLKFQEDAVPLTHLANTDHSNPSLSDFEAEAAPEVGAGNQILGSFMTANRQKIRDRLVEAERSLAGLLGMTVDEILQNPPLFNWVKPCVMDIARYEMDFLAARPDGKERCEACRQRATDWAGQPQNHATTARSAGPSAFAV